MARWAVPADLHSRITSGPLCPFVDHSHGSIDGLIPRYDDSHACVRCIAALTEGRLELDIRKIHPQYRRRFLEFWSFVDLASTSDCWEWRGPRYANGSSSYFPIPRHWGTSSQFAAPRVATWFTWGDVGRLPLVATCGNKFCCNPLHIRVRGVPHFHHKRQLAAIELSTDTRRLASDTSEFLRITKERAPARYRRLEKLGLDWIRLRSESDGPLSADAVNDASGDT